MGEPPRSVHKYT
jgi:hypothetical protein